MQGLTDGVRTETFWWRSKLVSGLAGLQWTTSSCSMRYCARGGSRARRRIVASWTSEAYDTVFRDGLWYRLLEAGLRGKLWRVLRNLYSIVESCVLVGNDQT